MTKRSAVLEPVMPADQEAQAIQALASALGATGPAAYVIGVDGTRMPLPDSVFQLLRAVLDLMKDGLAVQLVPFQRELTTQEAAELLNVSRPHLIKLLERGEMPYRLVGTHRRVTFKDVMAYKQQHEAKMQQGLEELARLSQEAGLY